MLIFDLEVGNCANMTISPFFSLRKKHIKTALMMKGICKDSEYYFANLYHSFSIINEIATKQSPANYLEYYLYA